MTKVSFYHGVDDKLQAAANWLAQASARREPVLIYAPDAQVAANIDRLLWTLSPTSFVPHCRADSALAAQTPLVIAADLEAPPHDGCLLNLGDQVPPGFSRFERVVEIVSNAEEDKLPARDRFKFYRDRGYALENQRFEAAEVTPSRGEGVGGRAL